MANLTPNTVQPGMNRPQMPQRGLVNPMGGQGIMPSMPQTPPHPSLGALGGLVKAHTITISPDGTQKHSVTHDIEGKTQKKETQGLVNTKPQPQHPPMKIINGMHHVPFQKADGSYGHINAQGESH
jgi:hypothetical protein